MEGFLRMPVLPLSVRFLLLYVLHLSGTAAAAPGGTKSYVVYLGGHSHGGGGATVADFRRAEDSHYTLLGSCLGSKEKAQDAIIYSYTKVFNAFAAHLDENQAEEISKMPEVLSVFPNTLRKLHTTRSWEFLGLERNGTAPEGSLWSRARYGEDVIIASLDTGVWPEAESFGDRGIGPVPARWKGYCEKVANPKLAVPCNRKLIGARHFSQGRAPGDRYESARDFDGHGTHTLSTAAGRPVPGANLFGIANGTAIGGSPSARVAAYKVCTEAGCYDADILAGFEAAIADGADVISVSLGGTGNDYLTSSVAIGSFHAVARGITVVCSAGNDGPMPQTVSNGAPWILTVAAGSAGRQFVSRVSLGNRRHTEGWSLASKHMPTGKYYPLIDAGEAKAKDISIYHARMCYSGSLDHEKVKGKIVICLRGDTNRVEKAHEVSNAGGVGMILANTLNYGDDLIAEPYMIPAVHVSYAAATTIVSYLNSTKSPVARIGKPNGHYGLQPAPFVAQFSSRGPNYLTPQILKPDILAPGMDILAAYSGGVPPTTDQLDTRRVAFNILSGTSMSCPHVSGVVGLLKSIYPHWSPAAIRSAIMTTARTRDNTGSGIKDSFLGKASPLDYGAGQIQPDRATDPGLVYDLTVNDYLGFLCTLGYNSSQMGTFANGNFVCRSKHMDVQDLNYPSITVYNLSSTTTVSRKLKNVGTPGTYRVRVRPPSGVAVSVNPEVLEFGAVGEEKAFQVTLAKQGKVTSEHVFGQLIWSDGNHVVRSPLVVRVA